MKLPRIKYNQELDQTFIEISKEKPEFLPIIKAKKNGIMAYLESSKDQQELRDRIAHAIRSSLNVIYGHVMKQNPNEEQEGPGAQIDKAMIIDELCYYGWLRYEMLMLDKEVAK